MEMIKNIKNFCVLAVALVAMAACSSNEDNPIDYQQVKGHWYSEIPSTGKCYDIRQGDQITEVTYDRVGVLVELEGGYGSWTHYYLKEGELVGYDGHYYAGFDYRIDLNGNLRFVSDEEDDEDHIASLNAFGLHYDASQDLILSEPVDGMVMQFSRVTGEQQKKLDAWDAIIDEDHIGLDDSEHSTDMDPDHATEPSR